MTSVLSTIIDPLITPLLGRLFDKQKQQVRTNVDHSPHLTTVAKRSLCILKCFGNLTRKYLRFGQESESEKNSIEALNIHPEIRL